MFAEDNNRKGQNTNPPTHPEREFHNFDAISEKALSQVAAHLASDGMGTQSRGSKDDCSSWEGSYGTMHSL